MLITLWKTCEYRCAKALDNLLINMATVNSAQIHPHSIHRLSTIFPQRLMTLTPLYRKLLEWLFRLSTATTSTTVYLYKIIYIEEE